MVRPYSPSPGTPRARATVYVPSVHVAVAVGNGPITTEYVADARARIQASTKSVLEITDPSKYAVTDTARKTLEGRKLFVINADTDMPAMTSARADRFLKICFDPDASIPKPKNQGDLEKVMKDTHGQYFVTVAQVSSASDQIFFLRAINKESNFVYIACSCGDFVTSANICAEAVAVAAEVGVIDLEVGVIDLEVQEDRNARQVPRVLRQALPLRRTDAPSQPSGVHGCPRCQGGFCGRTQRIHRVPWGTACEGSAGANQPKTICSLEGHTVTVNRKKKRPSLRHLA